MPALNLKSPKSQEEHMDRAMEDLDSALNELGMLSSSIKLTDYLKVSSILNDWRKVRGALTSKNPYIPDS